MPEKSVSDPRSTGCPRQGETESPDITSTVETVMDPDRCYIYVQGWNSDADLDARAEAAAEAAPKRDCVIVPSEEEWPDSLPTVPDPDCALVICGCEDHPHRFISCTANDFLLRKAFLDVEADC